MDLQPLGRDRLKRQYYAFSFYSLTYGEDEGSHLSMLCAPRIFAEHSSPLSPEAVARKQAETGSDPSVHLSLPVDYLAESLEWTSYSTYEDVNILLGWLNEKGIR